jgi:probable HAF family extracellular repeat protein
VWQTGKTTDLGTLGGAESDASAINEHNQIVGVSNTAKGTRHAVLWTVQRDT